MSDKKTEEPMIRFDGEWIPAHDVWKKMETVNVVADAIARFNEKFPHLASSETRKVVPLVRQRLKDIELRMPEKNDSKPQLGSVAVQLLDELQPEDALLAIQEHHGATMDLQELIHLAGEEHYLGALAREAAEFELNRISSEQTALLWNDAGRPAPGGGLWTTKKVRQLKASSS